MITLAKLTRNKRCDDDDDLYEFQEEKTPLEIESEKVLQVLPLELYLKVAPIVGLDEHIHEKITRAKKKTYRRLYRVMRPIAKLTQNIAQRDPIDEYSNSSVEPPTPRNERCKKVDVNPYYSFFQKTEREMVKWESKYLPPETEMEKDLMRRADDITSKICLEFCTYIQSLGGYDSPMFHEETLKEMFQFDFDGHIGKSTKVTPIELKAIPEAVAKATDNEHLCEKQVLQGHIKKDIRAERKKSKRAAFGKSLPKTMQWSPPANDTINNWTQKNKLNDKVVTMENVWGNITTLKSVQGFCQWMIDHPGVDNPIYLRKIGMLNREILNNIKTLYKFNANNRLPQIDVKKQLGLTGERKSSLPPIGVKKN